jgi:putative Mg2+ transporter-C (MgtC) family protein
MLEALFNDAGLVWPSATTIVRVAVRLIAAVMLGGLLGLEREWRGRAAGLRTHMMVALGAALFTLVPLEAGATSGDLANVVKGIAAGIGFLGAGTILKLAAEREIQGLTTASSIWLTGAVGLAAGAGHLCSAIIAIGLSLGILSVLGRWEEQVMNAPQADKTDGPSDKGT